MSYIIETENLEFSYDTGEKALKNISAKVSQGKKIAILGPNGSGKSTLMLHFNGVLKPCKGIVKFNGEPIKYERKSLTYLRQKISLMFQNPDDQIFAATVEEDIAFGPMNLGLQKEEVQKRVDEALDTVDMVKFRGRPTQHLSFGQRKRLALAGALAMNPDILMMDEPTAGLDPQMVNEMIELSEELNNKGKTIIICTHDVDMAYEWADEVILMYEGNILYNGDIEGLLEQEELLHRCRLKYPLIYKLNKQRSIRRREPECPRPYTLSESCQAFFKTDDKISPGKLHILYVDDTSFDPSIIKKCIKHNTGAFGIKAKKAAREMGLDIHHYFNAIDQGIIKTNIGEDYLLITDRSATKIINNKIDRFKRFNSYK
jgi:cobalt/nickel transport system ATP-binding protein